MTASLRSLRPGVKVLLSRWEYASVSDIIKDHNLSEVRIEVRDDLSLNVKDLEKKVGKGSVFYISMPNNPTGYFSPEDLKTIVETLSARDGGVIWDAPYIFTVLKITPSGAKFDRTFLQETLSELKKIPRRYHQHMCILSSLSKTCLIAGLRFGFATASEQWIENMNAIIGRENLSSPTPSFIVGAAILRRFLKNPINHEWLCRVLASRLTVLMEEIPDHLMLPRNGMFGALYVLVKANQDATKVADRLIKEHGIITVAGNQFYGGTVNAVRLSLVSVPWSKGDEAWIKSVRAFKKALA
jgi:aspartate/methionine/tyrosine aminotransferase